MNQPITICNETIRKILIDAYIYRDINNNNYDMTEHIEKLMKNNPTLLFNNLYKNKNNIYKFYNSLSLYDLQYLGF